MGTGLLAIIRKGNNEKKEVSQKNTYPTSTGSMFQLLPGRITKLSIYLNLTMHGYKRVTKSKNLQAAYRQQMSEVAVALFKMGKKYKGPA